MKQSLSEQIVKKFRHRWKEGNNVFVNSQTIQDYAHANIPHKTPGAHYKHETIGRCLRKLAEEGHLETLEGKSVSYRYIPTREELLSANMKTTLYGNQATLI